MLGSDQQPSVRTPPHLRHPWPHRPLKILQEGLEPTLHDGTGEWALLDGGWAGNWRTTFYLAHTRDMFCIPEPWIPGRRRNRSQTPSRPRRNSALKSMEGFQSPTAPVEAFAHEQSSDQPEICYIMDDTNLDGVPLSTSFPMQNVHKYDVRIEGFPLRFAI